MSMTADDLKRVPGAAGESGDDGGDSYRTMSAPAVAGGILGVLSVVALLNFWPPKAIPVFGVLVSLIALRQMARHPGEFAGGRAARLGLVLSSVFLVVGTAVSVLTPILEVPEGHAPITYEQLKPPAARSNVVPPSAVALDGQKVFIKGYMFPTAHPEGVRKFLLCRDNGDCCFGGQPPSSDMVWVELTEPLETEFSTAIRGVAGTFRIADSRLAGVNDQILYRLEADYIK